MSQGFRKGHTAAAKITAVDAAEIYRLWNEEGWSQARIARHYQMSETQIGRICRGTSWVTVPREAHHSIVERSQVAIDAAAPMPFDQDFATDLAQSLAKAQVAAVTKMPQMPVDPRIAERAAAYGVRSANPRSEPVEPLTLDTNSMSKPAIQAQAVPDAPAKGSMDAPGYDCYQPTNEESK